MKPFKWSVPKVASPRGPVHRVELDRLVEQLSGQIRGEPASDLEERLFVALGKHFGFENVEFSPSYLGVRNLTEVRPDFAVYGQGRIIIVYADGEFTHHTAEQKEHDRVQDLRLMSDLEGLADVPVRIPERELGSIKEAIEAVSKRW